MTMRTTLRALSTLAILGAAPLALGANAAKSDHPGIVSAAPFLALAGEADDPDTELVEISIGPQLLAALGKGFAGEEPEMAKLLGGLAAVNAVIVELRPASPSASASASGRRASAAASLHDRVEAARKLVADTSTKLLGDGWEALVRVRERDSLVSVLTRSSGREGELLGLAVMALEQGGGEDEPSDEGQLVFVNIAGRFDLSELGRIAEGLDIPGLEDIPIPVKP